MNFVLLGPYVYLLCAPECYISHCCFVVVVGVHQARHDPVNFRTVDLCWLCEQRGFIFYPRRRRYRSPYTLAHSYWQCISTGAGRGRTQWRICNNILAWAVVRVDNLQGRRPSRLILGASARHMTYWSRQYTNGHISEQASGNLGRHSSLGACTRSLRHRPVATGPGLPRHFKGSLQQATDGLPQHVESRAG